MNPVAAALAILVTLLTWHVPAMAEDDPGVRAALLEHKLAYLAADYAMGAASTAPAEEGESDEHVRIAAELEAMVARLPLPPDRAAAIASVGALVRRSAPSSEVSAAVERARAILVAAFAIPTRPPASLDEARGRSLFDQYCAGCHGLSGRADTERAASLRPRPANYLDPAIGEPLSPYRVTTTVRFGVDGTAMVPFGFLSESDRWDVAFYVMGLRHVAAPSELGPTFEVAKLATRSDAELRAELRASGVPESRVEPSLSWLRRAAPYEGPRRAGGRGALAMGLLALAVLVAALHLTVRA